MTPSAVPLMTLPAEADHLRGFRTGFHRCWGRWADASFEPCECDAVRAGVGDLGAVAEHEPCFRRSHGSLYKALDRGETDAEGDPGPAGRAPAGRLAVLVRS